MSHLSPVAVFLLFSGLAAFLAVLGFATDSWWPFAGAVASAAVAGLALTEPR